MRTVFDSSARKHAACVTVKYDQYIYNLATKLLSPGTWQIAIDLGDGSGKRLAPLISLKR